MEGIESELHDIPLPIYTAALPNAWRTPFELASTQLPVRHGEISLLAAISRDLELQAVSTSRTSLVISSFPDARRWMSEMDDFASMLAAKERPGSSAAEPEFDFIHTYDRDVIVECAQALMLRIARLEGASNGAGHS